MYIRHSSSEAYEKHLPKPVYIVYACVILVSILFMYWATSILCTSIANASNQVLDSFVEDTPLETTEEVEYEMY